MGDFGNPDRAEDLRVLLAEATPAPWRLCGSQRPGGCACGLVWSLAADCVVATVSLPREDAPGDMPVTAQHRANGRLLAAAVTHLPRLLDVQDAARALLAALCKEPPEDGDIEPYCAALREALDAGEPRTNTTREEQT